MTKQANTQMAKAPKPLTEEELNAKIALTGNLADLTPEQQMSYYARYCAHLSLDPITRPFDLLTTFEENGGKKTTLYANASCSAQLADKRGICYSKPEIEYNEVLKLVIIRVEAFMKLGDSFRGRWASGVAHIEGLKGKRLENAWKKAETQAHRRATLALCGVAMPDESEIEDIQDAHTSPLPAAPNVNKIPERYRVEAAMPTAEEVFDAPQAPSDQPLPAAWTADTPAREIADQEIANKIGEQLKKIHNEVKAEAPAPDPPTLREQAAQKLAEPKPDPTPGLAPTLTAAQQKVSDAVMTAWKEHGKDKATVLHLIGQFIEKPVKRSADLSDEEAEKVFGYLQTLSSQWSAEKQAEKTKPVYDRKNPAYGPETAKELDGLVRQLTVLKVSAADISNMIQDFVAGEAIGRRIQSRFELTDDEAREVRRFLTNKIGEIECERAMAADEV